MLDTPVAPVASAADPRDAQFLTRVQSSRSQGPVQGRMGIQALRAAVYLDVIEVLDAVHSLHLAVVRIGEADPDGLVELELHGHDALSGSRLRGG
jgi:hypothetical protein